MPKGLVTTAKDERLWARAKAQAAKQGHIDDYPYITAIYKRMKGDMGKSVPVSQMQAPGAARGIYIDPEALKMQRMAQEPPKRLTMDMLLESNAPIFRLEDVVRGVGLNVQEQDQVIRGLTTISDSHNEVIYRQSAYYALQAIDSIDPYQKKILMERAVRYYRRVCGDGLSKGLYIKSDWCEVPARLCEALGVDPLSKGVTHKYIRRVPYTDSKGKQRYRYYYKVTGGKGLGHRDEVKEGSKFRLIESDGHKEGHLSVIYVRGDQVTVKHDETGEEHTMSTLALQTLLHRHHGEKIKLKHEQLISDVRAARVHGTEKQRKKAESELHVHQTKFGDMLGEVEPANRTVTKPVEQGALDAAVLLSDRFDKWIKGLSDGPLDPKTLKIPITVKVAAKALLDRLKAKFGGRLDKAPRGIAGFVTALESLSTGDVSNFGDKPTKTSISEAIKELPNLIGGLRKMLTDKPKAKPDDDEPKTVAKPDREPGFKIPEPPPKSKPRTVKFKGRTITLGEDKPATEPTTERYNTEDQRKKLIQMGDKLYAAQEEDPTARDASGLNTFDMRTWKRLDDKSSSDPEYLKTILRKYRRQITAMFGEDEYHKVGLSDMPKGVVVDPVYNPTFGSVMLHVTGRIKNFKDYLYVHKNKYKCRFDGASKSWFIPKNQLADFDFEAYQQDLKDLDMNLGDLDSAAIAAQTAQKKEKKQAQEKPKEVTSKDVRDLRQGILGRQVYDTVAVVQWDDGRIGFYAPYSPDFNKLFSNKSGMLTGITTYNPTDHGRETKELHLAEEAIEKLQEMFPSWKIAVDPKIKQARVEKDIKSAELQKPIPEVASKLHHKYQLFAHQNEGVRFLDDAGGNALIGDDMGSGKSAMTLAWAAKNNKKVLVVCPKVVRRTWLQEASKYFPGHFHGEELVAKNLKKKGAVSDLKNVNLATVNFESLHKFQHLIEAAGFDTIVVDESHRIKNPKAKATKAVFDAAKGMKHRILLSGTAVKNKRSELIPQLDLVAPGKFTMKEGGKRILKNPTIGGLWQDLHGTMLARQKSEILKHLPPKSTSIVDLQVPNLEETKLEFQNLSAKKAEAARAKVPITLDFVDEIMRSSDSKVLLFTESVDAAKEMAAKLGDKAVLHHGQMSDDAREAAKTNFQKQDKDGNYVSKQRVFVTTRPSMAVGATLTAADKVVFNDLPWTAADIQQAEDRTHRPGQQKHVNVYWMTARNSLIDSTISAILKRKYDLTKKVNQGKQLTEEERAWMAKPVNIKEIQDQIAGKPAGLKKSKMQKSLYVGPRGGKYLDPQHKIPYTGGLAPTQASSSVHAIVSKLPRKAKRALTLFASGTQSIQAGDGKASKFALQYGGDTLRRLRTHGLVKLVSPVSGTYRISAKGKAVLSAMRARPS